MHEVVITKLYVRSVQHGLVTRSALVSRLCSYPRRKLTLITAPAGFGKTTLAALWLSVQSLPVCWVSLDENDNDLIRFLEYVAHAISTALPETGQELKNQLEGADAVSIHNLLTRLINSLTHQQTSVILALDDYHVINNPEVHAAVSFLLENLPPQMHLVLITRTEPPLALSKLRARGELTELRTHDLRFTWQEARRFLNETQNLGLSDEQITQLSEKTEGWVTGLQLAALSLASASDPQTLVNDLSGSDRYITDYLLDEVLARQPEEIEQFLLQTSIAQELCAGLCDALTGRSDGQQMLEALERLNLFLFPLDNTRTWYRYHHLFAELLAGRLKAESAAVARALHQKAAHWLIEHQLYADAIRHLFEMREYEQVAQLLQQALGDEFLVKAHFRTFLKWLDQIPDHCLVRYPRLLLYQAFQLWEMQQLPKFHSQLALVERLLGPDIETGAEDSPENAYCRAVLAVIKGVVHCGSFDAVRASPYLARALDLLPPDMSFWRILALGATGFCYRVQGDYQTASGYFQQVIDATGNTGPDFLCFMYSLAQTLVYAAQGRLRDAIEACRVPLALDARRSYSIPFSGLAYTVMGRLLFLSGDLAGAEQHVRRGIGLVTQDGDAYYIAAGYFNLAQILAAKHDIAGSLAVMDQMIQVAADSAWPPSAQTIAAAYRAHIQIICGQAGRAALWAQNPGSEQLDVAQYPDIQGQLHYGIYCTVHETFQNVIASINMALARYYLATKQPETAASILDQLLAQTDTSDQAALRAEVFLLKALALYRVGQPEPAASCLLEAVDLVADEPYWQLFINPHEPMEHLLHNAVDADHIVKGGSRQTVRAAFIGQVLQKAKSQEYAPAAPYLVCPDGRLTTREIEVLSQLADGLAYQEIASQMAISSNTVKTHLKRAYDKLDVTNRLQAVNKAKALGLVK